MPDEFEIVHRVQRAIKAARPAIARRIMLDPVASLIAKVIRQVAETPEPDRDYALLDATGAILNLMETDNSDITRAMAGTAEHLLHRWGRPPVGDSQT
jgi:hypothetical protein